MTSQPEGEPLRDPWERLMVGPTGVIDEAPTNMAAFEALFGPNPLKTADWYLINDGKHTIALIDMTHPRLAPEYAASTGQARRHIFQNVLLPSASRYGENCTDLPTLVLGIADGAHVNPVVDAERGADFGRSGRAVELLLDILPIEDRRAVESVIALSRPDLSLWLTNRKQPTS